MADRARVFPAVDVSWPSRPDSERLELLLAELDGCEPSAVEDTPTGLRVFFHRASDRARARDVASAWAPEATVTAIDVSDEAWAERSQAALEPVVVGRFVVAPPWKADVAQSEAANSERQVVVIQPSMGFGTGHHPTTRLCLSLLQRRALAGRSMLDVGTGSGVLAIVAALLGAATVVGIDEDEDALTSARENVELNHGATHVQLRAIDLTEPASRAAVHPADVVTANLTGGMLMQHAAAVRSLVAPGGVLITSGFQEDERAAVADAFGRVGLRPAETEVELTWTAVLFEEAHPHTPSR